MNKLINKYRDQMSLLKDIYTKEDISYSNLIPLAITLFFYLPIVVALVSIFNVYIMRPYLCFILCGLTAIFMALFFSYAKKKYLKSVKTDESIDYEYICYFEFIHLTILITLICVISMIILVPIFII